MLMSIYLHRDTAAGWMPTAAQKKARPDKYGEGSEEYRP